MEDSFEMVWAELRAALSRQPRCPEHPEYPCVRTLKGQVANDVLNISAGKIDLHSHRKGSQEKRTIEMSCFRTWWEYLVKNGTASLDPDDRINTPHRRNPKIVGAIWAHCLPERIEYISEQDSIRLRARDALAMLPEEIPDPTGLTEGAVRRITVNAYEREPAARRQCIAAHGTNCSICEMSFGEAYGPEAEGYIHVHHLRPLSEIGGEYTVDPVKDLRPVCPNCHAVLHLGGRCRSIEEVREMLRP